MESDLVTSLTPDVHVTTDTFIYDAETIEMDTGDDTVKVIHNVTVQVLVTADTDGLHLIELPRASTWRSRKVKGQFLVHIIHKTSSNKNQED